MEIPPRDGYCCGQYASYWNAFLFLCAIAIQKMDCVDVKDTVHTVRFLSVCDLFVWVMSHMNRFQTHSVRLQCAIPICIYSKSHAHFIK